MPVEDSDAEGLEAFVGAYDGCEVSWGVELLEDGHPEFIRECGHGGTS